MTNGGKMNQRPSAAGAALTVADVAAMIDHSLLRPDMAFDELMEGFQMAKQYQAATCCVRPNDMELALGKLDGSGVRVSTVVGFPHGAHTIEIKVREAEKAMDTGVFDLDMVLAIGRMKSGDHGYVEEDIRAVVDAGHDRSAIVKVIFDCVYLTDEEIVKACQICEKVGADYVKTSTGYSPGGATIEDVILMRRSCSPRVAVKAAGGIRTLDDTLRYRAAGAKMIGTRSTKEILEEAVEREKAGTLREVSL
jgi:deoxyribose-phosphate aldolase